MAKTTTPKTVIGHVNHATTSVHVIGKKSELHYYTKEGVEITDKVRAGYTKVFDDLFEAQKYAAQGKSYTYDVCNKNGEFMCYGVPK